MPPETINLLLGHLFYGLLVGAIALFAAAVSESSATAAIITLAFTIGSWVLDFALAGQPGLLEWISRLSLTQTLRPFEQGLLSAGLVLGIVAAICGFAALATIWLHPGIPLRAKLVRSIACVAMVGAVLALATQVRTSFDLTEDRRNSFPAADESAWRASRAARHRRSPGSRRPALCRSAAKRYRQARTHACEVTVRLAGERAKRLRQRQRGGLRRSRVFVRRSLGHESLNQPSRGPAAALRIGWHAYSGPCPRPGLPRLPVGATGRRRCPGSWACSRS